MATGQLPFNAEAPLVVLEKIRDAEPEPFVALDPAFPPAAAKIIGKLLQKDPDIATRTPATFWQTSKRSTRRPRAIDVIEPLAQHARPHRRPAPRGRAWR